MPEVTTFEAANRWLAGLVNVPTDMTAAELALAPDFPPRAKAHAFFSARVTEANVLDALRAEVSEFAEGRTDIASARMRLKTFLAGQGFPADDVGMTDSPPAGVTEEEWAERRKITNLASTRRLDLILRQNAGMAHAVGRREVSMHPAVLERWPFFRYLARDDGLTRESHARLDNLVLRKQDPFWHTHTPPWDYNCRCDIEDADAEEAGKLGEGRTTDGGGKVLNGATGQVVEVLPNESGYEFDIDAAMSEFDMSAIRDLDLRRATHAEMVSEMGRTGSGLTLRGAGAMARGELTVRAPENIDEIRMAFSHVHDAVVNDRNLPELRVSLGRVLEEHADSLGIDPGETSMWFNSPGQKRRQGAAHWVLNHPGELAPDTAVNLLERTIWNSAASVREHIKGPKARRLVFEEAGGEAIATLRRRGSGWELDIESGWDRKGSRYGKK